MPRLRAATLVISAIFSAGGCGQKSWETSLPVPAPASATSPAGQRPPGDHPTLIRATDSPEEIRRKVIEAYGGSEKLNRWRVGYVKYQARFPAEGSKLGPFGGVAPVVMEEYFQYPNQFKRIVRPEIPETKEAITYVMNGKHAWDRRPGRGTRAITVPGWGTRTEHMFSDYYNVSKLEAGDVRVVGEEEVEGRPTVVVRFGAPEASPVHFFFDKGTGLIAKSAKRLPKSLSEKEAMSETILSAYRDFDGGRIPTRIVARSEGKVFVDVTLIDVKFSEKLDEEVFAKPE